MRSISARNIVIIATGALAMIGQVAIAIRIIYVNHKMQSVL